MPAIPHPFSATQQAVVGPDAACRILHLEDNRLDAELIATQILQDFPNCQLDRADCRDQFLTALNRNHGTSFDLILSDYSLPEFDGLSAMRLARERFPDMPVIFVSGAIGEEKAIDTLKAGATDYVLKHRLGRLGPSIRRALEDLHQRRARSAAEAALRVSEERFRLATEALPQIVWTALPDGTVDYFNHRWFDYTGLSAEESLGWAWSTVLHPDDRDGCRARWRHSLETSSVYEIEYRFRRGSDHQYRWHLGRALPLFNTVGRIIKWFGTCTDIEDQKLAQEVLKSHNDVLEQRVRERTRVAEARSKELARSEAAFKQQSLILRSVLNSIGDGVAVFDQSKKLTLGNPAADLILGTRLSDAGSPAWNLQHELFAEDGITPIDAEVLPISRALAGENVDEEVFLLYHHMTGRKTWISATSRPLIDEMHQPRGAVSVFRDITRQKLGADKIREYQERLRSLASQLTRTEERERRRISQALHDYLGQLLVGVKMRVDAMRTAEGVQQTNETHDIQRMLGEAIQYTRNLVFELSPPVLYELGLSAAISWLANQMRKQHGLQADVRIDDVQTEPLREEASVVLFQSVRELLLNVTKHAQADRATISMRRTAQFLQLIVEDNGKGFDSASGRVQSDSFGLFNVRERLDLIAGNLRIESTAGKGTRAIISVPLSWAEIPKEDAPAEHLSES